MDSHEPMEIIALNRDGGTPLLLTCEHATNAIPAGLKGLGLPVSALADHVAWDIGALDVAKLLSGLLDAPLIAAPASRLLIDPNRALDAPDLIPVRAVNLPVPGNLDLSPLERGARVAAYHVPYHAALAATLAARRDIAGLVSIHSFTPELNGVRRPWHVGVLHDEDRRLADPVLDALRSVPGLVVGRNEPYAPDDGVFYAMRRHAGGRAAVMLEIRNDLISDGQGRMRWAQILARAIGAALPALEERIMNLG